MKKVFLLLLFTLVACTKPSIKTDLTNNSQIPVETLFTYSNCTVYRFLDNGHYLYFVNCKNSSQVIGAHTVSCGKNCIKEVKDYIETSY